MYYLNEPHGACICLWKSGEKILVPPSLSPPQHECTLKSMTGCTDYAIARCGCVCITYGGGGGVFNSTIEKTRFNNLNLNNYTVQLPFLWNMLHYMYIEQIIYTLTKFLN